MNIHHIRYFLAVAKTRNFSQAARQCNVSQPALSRAIQQLEEEVGGLLLRRERSLTHLTDLGALLRPRFEQVLEQFGGVRREASQFLRLDDARLKVGVMRTIGSRRFVGLLADFNRCHSGIQLQFLERNPQMLAEALQSGEIDLAIMSANETIPERCDVRPLYRERFVLAFPAEHRFAAFDTIPIAEMDGETYLQHVDCDCWEHLYSLCSGAGVSVRMSHSSEHGDWIQDLVAAGFGVCFVPEHSALTSGLQSRPVAGLLLSREVSLVTVAGRRFSPAVRTFVKAVASHRWAEGATAAQIAMAAEPCLAGRLAA